MLSFLKTDKAAYSALIKQTDRCLETEQRQELAQWALANPEFGLRVALDILDWTPAIKDPKVRTDKLRLAAEILSRKRFSKACAALAAKLNGNLDKLTRQAVHQLLQRLATDEDIPALISMMRADRSATRAVAVECLRKRNRATAGRWLMAELQKPAWTTKADGLSLLHELGRAQCLQVCRALMLSEGESHYKDVIALLERLASDETVQILHESIEAQNSPALRLLILQALVRIGNPSSFEMFEKLLGESQENLVLAALDGLARLQNPQVLPAVTELLYRTELAIRMKAIRVVGSLGREDDVDLLLPALGDCQAEVKQAAREAISSIAFSDRADVSRVLLRLMAGRDDCVREFAVEILKQTRDLAVFDKIFDHVSDATLRERECIIETLAFIRDGRVVPSAIRLFGHEKARVRRFALEVLIGMGDPMAVKPTLKMLEDPDWWAREIAVEALGRFGDKQVTPLLLDLLQKEETRYVSAKALGDLRDPRAVEPLVKLLDAGSTEEKLVILDGLAKLNAANAVEPIKKLLIDPDKNVRNKANDVLTWLGAQLKIDIVVAERWWEKHNLSRVDSMLLNTKAQKGTDLLLVAESPPLIRIDGDLNTMDNTKLSQEEIWELLSPILTPQQIENLKRQKDLDFSHEIQGEGRFRGNVFFQKNGINAVFRLVPDTIPSREELRLPKLIEEFAAFKQRMILISGPASCGKTTTMAALIQLIAATRQEHVITIEDPIECLYPNDQLAVITQRDVGQHTESFAGAVRASLREDPDVIVIGEIRDHETVANAITAAETGHLVLATIHAISAAQTLNRIVDFFPSNQHEQVSTMIADSIGGIICQKLLSREDGKGRIAAFETLLITPAISNMIREGKIFQIPDVMATGQQYGMRTIDQDLAELARTGMVSKEEALAKAYDPDVFTKYFDFEPDESNEEAAHAPN